MAGRKRTARRVATQLDNFTHSLTGWALGQTGLKDKSRKGLAALILGANMPDIDVFFGWVSWAPLAVHRGFTHSLVGGVLFLPPILAGLLWLLDRWQLGRGATFNSGLPMRVGWLVGLSYIGAASHPLLDLQNTYAVQLLSPLSSDWFHNDALFIIDVWLWGALALGIGLSRLRERRGGEWMRPARIALAVAVTYISLNAGLSVMAKRALADSGAIVRPDALFAGHEPVRFWRRNLVWRENGAIGRARYGLFAGLHDVQPARDDHMDDPLARRAKRADASVIAFMRWSVVPTARIEREQCVATVRFGDARFGQRRVSTRFEQRVRLALTGRGCPAVAARLPSLGEARRSGGHG